MPCFLSSYESWKWICKSVLVEYMWLHLAYDFAMVCIVGKHVESFCNWFYFLELLLWIDCGIGSEGFTHPWEGREALG